MNNNLNARWRLNSIILFGAGWTAQAHQIRDTFRQVKPSVVEAPTKRGAVAPFPQEGSVLEVGLGSGVLISDGGQALTAAHVVQSADLTLSSFLTPIRSRFTD